jgi:hypothetical protein
LPYTTTADESDNDFSGNRTAVRTNAPITRDDTRRPLTNSNDKDLESIYDSDEWKDKCYKNANLEIPLDSINIDGNYYFSLRELGYVIGFNVSYDPATKDILIDTSSYYNVPTSQSIIDDTAKGDPSKAEYEKRKRDYYYYSYYNQ